ncbi:MAG: Flp pilus assembly complex ATPase component TadA [Pseudomonadales bacterium]|nr:Flp pilus assembly complex ATPase component TadA [Pseudomonadales bacterium]NRA15014.1 Flp pilus assembly complex ATPase component TadA [Oceanospirillaceae bacterium]
MFEVVVITDKGANIERVRCTLRHCTIGKSRDNLVQIRGWRVAQVHCKVELTDKGLYVEDVSEGSGISVNGNKVPFYGPIRSSDVISIGSYDFRLGAVEDKQADSVNISPSDNKAQPQVTKVAADEDWSMQTFIGGALNEKAPEDRAGEIERQRMFMWRNRIHQEVLRMMDLKRTDVGAMDADELRQKVEALIDDALESMGGEIPDNIDVTELKTSVLNEAVGLGPLEELLADDEISEIMVNAFDDIYIEKNGKLMRSDIAFSSDAAVMSAIERIVSPLGRRIDESSPMVDARLPDGSRVNAIIPPLALRGPTLTIRKFSKKKLNAEDLMNFGTINQPMATFLQMAVEQHCNIIISGGTGSGKTTLLNIMSNFIPQTERIITVEDAAELKLVQPHVVSLESRPANLEGKGAIPIRDLVRNCLRMRPDRIVVGECRGGEALDMLTAMNTGHDGSLTTVHANTPRDVISRLEVMVMMAGMDLPARAIREQIASAVHVIVQQSRLADGSRKITHISEITGMEGNTVQLNDIFVYQQEGFDESGKVVGQFQPTGQVPQFYESLRSRGIKVDMSIFG